MSPEPLFDDDLKAARVARVRADAAIARARLSLDWLRERIEILDAARSRRRAEREPSALN
jgi:hypothetical protein